MSQPKLDVYGYGCKLFMTLDAGDQPVDRVLLWPVADRLRQSLLRRRPQRDQLLHRIVLSGINSIKLWKDWGFACWAHDQWAKCKWRQFMRRHKWNSTL
jgi:hypothetical protein